MATISNIALSGMRAAQMQLNASANNVANGSTPDYRREEVQQSPQSGGGVLTQTTRAGATGPALEADVVNQLQAKNSFLANLAVFRTGNRMAGALLNEKA